VFDLDGYQRESKVKETRAQEGEQKD